MLLVEGKTTDEIDSIYAEAIGKTCFVTRHDKFIRRFRELGNFSIEVRSSIADIVGKKDCNVYIVDTEVPDIHLWPAPILTDPEAFNKTWLFLVPKLSETHRMEMFPNNSWCFTRNYNAISEVVSFLKQRVNPELARKIKEVNYLENVCSFFIRMENNKDYILKVGDLPEADSSGIIEYEIGENNRYFRVKQKSGNEFEVPWDDILYHCEPRYEYYKGNQDNNIQKDRVERVSNKIRQLRKAKGVSITDLAKQAGMKRPNLSRIESGKHLPSLETIERLSEALKVPVAEIVSFGSNR